MSADLYKTQATRLAEHLKTVHGIKLKPSSMLEAIASVHGTRDWNTLAAGQVQPSAPTAAPQKADTAMSPAEQLFRSAVASGAHQLTLMCPSSRSVSSQGTLTYDHNGMRMRGNLSAERTAELHGFLLGLAGMNQEPVQETHWSHGQFSYQAQGQEITGSIRRTRPWEGEQLAVEWEQGGSFTRRVVSLADIEPWVQHFSSPKAHGLYLIADMHGVGGGFVAEAIASRVPSRSFVQSHDFEVDDQYPGHRCDIDVTLGILSTQEGVAGMLPTLEAGQLALARVYARNAAGALEQVLQTGMREADLRQHLRGVLAMVSLRTTDAKGAPGMTQLYEQVLLETPQDYDALRAGRLLSLTLREQASKLVAAGRVSLEEVNRAFGA